MSISRSHNGLVAGSSPAGSTFLECTSQILLRSEPTLRSIRRGFYSLLAAPAPTAKTLEHRGGLDGLGWGNGFAPSRGHSFFALRPC